MIEAKRLAILHKTGSSDVEDLVSEVLRLRSVIYKASNILFDTKAHDIEHTIECHSDTLPVAFRLVAGGADEALDVLQVVVQEWIG